VYRATQLRLKRTVALKLIAGDLAQDATFRARFQHESEIAAQIEHPHVIPLYEAGEENDLLFITMRYVEGTDLKAMIGRQGALEPKLAAKVLAQVCAALDAAHARGLVHRDIKPGNVLIAGSDTEPHAYLTDFGLTKQASSQGGMTKTGMFVGTLDYIAPEQLQGKPVDARADVYALGCMLYQMLVGKVPYQRDSEPAKIWAHMSEPPPSITEMAPQVPAAFEDVIKRAMAKDPEERYPSAGDLGRAAAAAAQDRQAAAPERSVAMGQAAPQPDATAYGGAPPTAYGAAGPTAFGGGTQAPGGPAEPPPFPGPPPAGATYPGAAPASQPGATYPGQAPSRPGGPATYPGQALGQPPAPSQPVGAKKRNRAPLIAGAAVAALLVIGLVLFLLGSGDSGGGKKANENPAGKVVGPGAQLMTQPIDLSAGEGAVWLANGETGTVTRVDAETMRVIDVPLGEDAIAGDVAAGNGAVWVDSFADRITRIDAASNETTDVTVPEATEVRLLALDESTGTLWALAPKKSHLTAIDTTANKAGKPIDPDTGEGASLAAGDGFAYVLRTTGELVFVSEDSNSVVGEPADIARPDTAISDNDYQDGTIYPVVGEDMVGKFDATSGTEGQAIDAGPGFGAGVVQGDSLWAAYPADRLLRRFNLDSGKLVGEPIKLDRPPALLTADDTGIYIVSQGRTPTLVRVEPGS
jgi:serine/threonine-protein kinase